MAPGVQGVPGRHSAEEFAISFDLLLDGPKLVEQIDCDGLLIDTYHKGIGKGLLDYYDFGQLEQFVALLTPPEKRLGLPEASPGRNCRHCGLPVSTSSAFAVRPVSLLRASCVTVRFDPTSSAH